MTDCGVGMLAGLLLLLACMCGDDGCGCRFMRHLGDDLVDLTHYGVGYVAAHSVAEAMRLNPPLRSLILADNWLYEEGAIELSRFV